MNDKDKTKAVRIAKPGKTSREKRNTSVEDRGSVLRTAGSVILRVLSYAVNIILTLLLIVLLCGVIIGSVFAVYIKNNLDLEVDSSMLVSAAKDTTTRVYYIDYETEEDRQIRNGTPVELEDERLYGSVNSLWADYSSMPENLINAFIAVEDHRFKTHNGVDWVGTSKAVVNYFVGFEEVRGASTITQQLVKNLTGDDDVSIQRKVEEIFRALNLEKQMSKEEILEMYLNIVYLGNNCYGVRTAAGTYFNKDISELTLVECAALAGIVKNPSRYEPLYHDDFTFTDENGEEQRDGNKHRRATVLYTMKEHGYISENEYEAALNEELKITYFDEKEEDEDSDKGYTVHSWYVDSVITQIIEDLMEKNDWPYALASTKLYTSGYSIYIPMDPEIQSILEEVYENEENLPKGQTGLQPESAMVITDPYTGDVLGLVGGRGEKSANLITNRATVAVRPVGSSIKPISVYAPAMDRGIINIHSVVDDSPIEYRNVVHGAGTSWQWTERVPYPRNYPNVYRGPVNIDTAVKVSINTVAMKVLNMLTVEESFNFLKNTLHIESLVERIERDDGSVITDMGPAALSLGQFNYGLTVEEMAGAFSIFPNNGLFESPNLYLYVKDSAGNIVLENEHYTEVAIKESTAHDMTKLLMNVMSDWGTGASVTLRHKLDVAGKTGTTSADYDRYFVGYTPYFVGATWVGYDYPSSLSAFSNNPACTIWDTVMTRVHQKYIDDAAAGGEPLKTFDISQTSWREPVADDADANAEE